MIWKKYILIKLFIVTGFVGAFATPQAPDILVYNGDTISIYMNTLPDEFYKFDTVTFDSREYINHILNVNLFEDKKSCWTTACGDGYQVMWEIVDKQLYLVDIYSCCNYQDSIKADLSSLFKGRIVGGKVKADWVTGNFRAFQGERLLYNHYMVEGGVFEYELEFHFEKGKLANTRLYDNRKSKESIYSKDLKLQEYIYGNINWEKLPQNDSTIRVIVQFSANEKGIIDSVEVLKGYNEIYDQEAIRVIRAIPEWDIYFQKGEHLRMSWHIQIIFSKKKREEYGK